MKRSSMINYIDDILVDSGLEFWDDDATEIAENLESALEQFQSIVESLQTE